MYSGIINGIGWSKSTQYAPIRRVRVAGTNLISHCKWCMQDMAAHSSARLTPNIIASNVLYDITKQEKESASHVENQMKGKSYLSTGAHYLQSEYTSKWEK